MFSVNPKWYRVYNATSEYFILAESPQQASNAVCDRIFNGAGFIIEYATKSAVCSNIGRIIGGRDKIADDAYYHEIVPKYWYAILYESFGVTRSTIVSMACDDEAYDCFVNNINSRGDCKLIDIHAATKNEVIDDMCEKDILDGLDDFEYAELLNSGNFKA